MSLLKRNNKKTANAEPVGSRPSLRGGLAHQLSTDPFLDWVIILIIGLGVALVLVGIGVSVYLGTGRTLAGDTSAGDKKPGLPIDEALLDKTLKEYADRAAKRSSIPSTYAAPRDPSLP